MPSILWSVFPRGYSPRAQILFFVGLAFLIWGIAVNVSARVFPSPVTGVTLGDLLASLVLIGIGVSLTIWALVGARPTEEDARGRR